MAEIEQFKGFFSYSHHDAETDPKLIGSLTARLEKRVSGKLTNANFAIWRDVKIRAHVTVSFCPEGLFVVALDAQEALVAGRFGEDT